MHTCTYTPTTHTCTQDGRSPLYDASSRGHDGIVVMLLQAGATVDLQAKVEDCYYDSTLFICVSCMGKNNVFLKCMAIVLLLV